jgi:two-component sensor histidine kinase
MAGYKMRNGAGQKERTALAARLVTFDIGRLLGVAVPAWLAQLVLAFACCILALLLRLVIDQIAPGTGPYAPIFPALLLAVLFGGVMTGLLTGAMILGYIWLVVLPAQDWGGLDHNAQMARLWVVLLTSSVILLFGGIFRRAAREALAERNRRIEEMDLYLSEFEHRVKNNFTSVVALLDMQRKRATDSTAAAALAEAMNRVASMARAHLHLYHDGGGIKAVDAERYLNGLTQALADGPMLPPGVSLICQADPVEIERDRAITIGLLVNELVTNAAKYAFIGRDAGTVTVLLEHVDAKLRLLVADDGIGMASDRPEGGLGSRLIDAFVRQLKGKAKVDTGPEGTRTIIEMPA